MSYADTHTTVDFTNRLQVAHVLELHAKHAFRQRLSGDMRPLARTAFVLRADAGDDTLPANINALAAEWATAVLDDLIAERQANA